MTPKWPGAYKRHKASEMAIYYITHHQFANVNASFYVSFTGNMTSQVHQLSFAFDKINIRLPTCMNFSGTHECPNEKLMKFVPSALGYFNYCTATSSV